MKCLSFVYLSTETITIEGSRSSKKTKDQYLRRNDGTPFNISPFIMPFDATITNITAATRSSAFWTAEVHSNGSATGAELVINGTSKGSADNINVQFYKDQEVEIYLKGDSVPYPSVNVIFQKNI